MFKVPVEPGASAIATDARRKIRNFEGFRLTSSLPHTRASAATIGCTKGTRSQPIDEDRLDKLLRYRKCSTRSRMCRTSDHPCAETNRIADNGFAGQTCPSRARRRGLEP